MDELIYNQTKIPKEQWRYGFRSSAATGCGWIAVYNALRLMGYYSSPENLIRYFERQLPGDDNGAWHSSDLWYWFGTLSNCWRPMEQQDRMLSGVMVDYLSNFVKTGNPNGASLPQWVASGKGQKQVMRFGNGKPAMGKPNMLKMIHTMLTNKAVGE